MQHLPAPRYMEANARSTFQEASAPAAGSPTLTQPIIPPDLVQCLQSDAALCSLKASITMSSRPKAPRLNQGHGISSSRKRNPPPTPARAPHWLSG
ncbi:unnamed protein product [Gulo gulo]|uniref:Uncharacterized protein n=1 Tax=Gulo gulo TaxID=48420 RepID=A0A9X9M5K3_GULGU|nr:unnamed protein product [Gulo gulo]